MEPRHIYCFADIEVDALKGCIRKANQNPERSVRLSQHDLQVLIHLIENRHRLVTKEELLDIFWKDTQVTPDSLVQCVKKIRRSIGDDSRRPRFVETVPKVGYHFIGKLEDDSSAPVEPVEPLERAGVRIAARRQLSLSTPTVMALAVAILATVSAYFYFHQRRTADGREFVGSLPNGSRKQLVAVLYFENLSGEGDLDWLSVGLADMFITDFSRSPSLTAIGRDHLHFLLGGNDRKSGEKIPFELALEVARRSQADALVMGSFARFGEKLRIDVWLHDARTGKALRTASLNIDKLDQIPGQIDLLALKLSSQLGTPVAELEHIPGLSQVMTDSLEAYRYYSLALEKAESLHNKEAVTLLEKAIALDPRFAMAYARIGYVFAIRWNLIEQSRPYLERAFQLSEHLGEKDRLTIAAWYQIANLDYSAAIRSYREITLNYPLDVEAHLRLGHLLAGEDQRAEAIDVLKRGLAIDPESKDIYNELGNVYSSLSRHDEAIAMHRQYVALTRNEPNAYDSLGMSFQWAGRYEEAIAAYNNALLLNPDFEVALIHLANAYYQTGRYRQALPLYQRYITIAPSDKERSRGYGCVANIYLRWGRLVQAEQAARREVRYEPTYMGTTILLALRRGNTAVAEKVTESGITTANRGARNTSRGLYYFGGLIALKQGRRDNAIADFKDALRREPPRWSLDTWEDCLATAYLEIGKVAEAITEYERVLAANPYYPLARYHLAEAYERNGERQKATVEYQRFLQDWRYADPDLHEMKNARKSIRKSQYL